MPHDIRTVKTDLSTLREKTAIPFFPLFQESSLSEQTNFSLQVSRDMAGAIVNIQANPDAASDDKKINGYLLDISSLQQATSELLFNWQRDNDSSVFTVKIEQSDDLMRWVPLVYRATLADLQFEGQQVERRSVVLPRQPLKYLKLTWLESASPLRLTEVSAFSQVIESRRKRQWVVLTQGTAGEQNQQLAFDFVTSYHLPASSVQIGFPQTNSIARLSIQSRSDSKQEWRTRCEQVFYDLTLEGSRLQNDPCNFSPTADPLWRVLVLQDGAGLHAGKRSITMQLGWQANELVFIGRGTPPYLLAYGSGKLAQQDKEATVGLLLQTMQQQSPAQVTGKARLGKKIVLSGEPALQSPAQPRPWKKWLLWTVLLLGVGLLALMVRSLTKEMKRAEEKKVSEEG